MVLGAEKEVPQEAHVQAVVGYFHVEEFAELVKWQAFDVFSGLQTPQVYAVVVEEPVNVGMESFSEAS